MPGPGPGPSTRCSTTTSSRRRRPASSTQWSTRWRTWRARGRPWATSRSPRPPSPRWQRRSGCSSPTVSSRKATFFGSARTLPEGPPLHPGPPTRGPVVKRRLDGRHRSGTWDHGSSHGGRRPRAFARSQHQAPSRARREPVHRPRPQARRDAVLLHPQAHAHKRVPGLRGVARRLRNTRRGIRAAHSLADRKGPTGSAGPARRARWDLLGILAGLRHQEVSESRGPPFRPRTTLCTVSRPTWRMQPKRSSGSTATTTPAGGSGICS